MNNKTLIEAGALRQFKHNDGSDGFVAAYDLDIVNRVTAQDALDAARYRWLRSGANHNASWLVGTYAQEDLDAQLDAAMKELA